MSRTKQLSRFGASIVFALVLGVSFTACVGSDESPATSDEDVGEAAQAVSEGGVCNPLQGLFCDSGLTCCAPTGVITRRCRNLQNDELNCGACNNVCTCSPGHTPWCFNSVCNCLPT